MKLNTTTVSALVIAIAMILGLGLASPAVSAPVRENGYGTANASTSTVAASKPAAASKKVQYLKVDALTVCNSQGHTSASFWWYWNPGSWYCYDISIPAGITFAPGPDFGKYCRSKGYTGAEAWPRHVFGWRCYKVR